MIIDGCLNMTETIKYQMNNIEIRKSKVNIAYNLENVLNSEFKIWKLSKHKLEKTIKKDHYNYLFKNMAKDGQNITQQELEILVNFDKQAKEFFLKWILYIESQIKEILINILSDSQVSNTTIYRVLINSNVTKSIVNSQFKNIKSDFMFKSEFSTLKIKRSESDPNGVTIVECPFPLFLENLSLSELGKVLNQILLKIDLSSKDTLNNYKYLYLLKESFLELAFIRNSAAHGNPLIPIILDNNFNANYLYEMASAFPSWNSKDNVEKWELFHFIRFTTRSLYKQGIPLVNASGPQLGALAFTKALLMHPAKRSFFMFFFVMLSTFEYIDSTNEVEFWDEASFFIHNLPEKKESINYLNEFPSSDYSVKSQLTRLILPLISYRTYEHDGFFKAIVESTIKIPQKTYLVTK